MANNSYSFGLTNPLSALLQKPSSDFQRSDLLKFIRKKKVERITFHYTALDGRLKELKFPVASPSQAELILAEGERVDGSSLFKGIISTDISDLYVLPEYESAFLNPFDEGSLDFICRFLTKEGTFAPFAPDAILRRACSLFRKTTGLELFVSGELEFFLISDKPALFPLQNQIAYQEAAPFVKSTDVLNEVTHHLSQVTGAVKYAHSEVGFVNSIQSENEEIDGKYAEQLEVEFSPKPAEKMADALVLGKWLVRNIAYRHSALATFTPKIEEGVPGNGLHFHLELRKNKKNVMANSRGKLSQSSLGLISGLCEYADSLTAFGNTVPSSYLRLVPDFEAPTHIFWSELNRSAMIRVPLGWANAANLASLVNPQEKSSLKRLPARQTIELRTPDGSANIHLLLAGVALAAERGLSNKESGELAKKYHATRANKADSKAYDTFPLLPSSCVESARILDKKRKLYERQGIFPPAVIDYVISTLRAEKDGKLLREASRLPGKERLRRIRRLMHKHLHRH